MGIEFIDRSLRTTSLVLLIFFPFGLYYLGIYPALAIISGSVWSIVNMIFISAMVRTTLQVGDINKGKAIGLSLIKFPALYASGYFLLKVPQFEVIMLLVGFSSFFIVIILKAVARAMLHLNDSEEETHSKSGATHVA